MWSLLTKDTARLLLFEDPACLPLSCPVDSVHISGSYFFNLTSSALHLPAPGAPGCVELAPKDNCQVGCVGFFINQLQ